MSGSRITGWGSALPDRIVTNEELSLTLDTTDDWIRERTGIRERRIGTSTAELAAAAGAKAIAQAGVDPATIDVLILATTTPDRQIPASASRVQEMMGLDCGAFDMNAACSGFVYGVTVANGLLMTGAERALVIGAETMSRVTNWEDRGTAILFGDGAGAVVMERTEDDGAFLGWSLMSNGKYEDVLYAEHDGGTMIMEGREVFRQAVMVMAASSNDALAKAGVTIDDIALVVPHQANIRIIEAACKRLGAPMERTAIVLDRTGNTSSASIPLALVDALDNNRVSPGDLVLLVGFGAGMTAAASVIRWTG